MPAMEKLHMAPSSIKTMNYRLCIPSVKEVLAAKAEDYATIPARRILNLARSFGASTEQRGLGDPEQRCGLAGVSGNRGFDLGQEARLRPLAHIRLSWPRPNDVLEKGRHLVPGG